MRAKPTAPAPTRNAATAQRPTFPYAFKIFDAAHVHVILTDEAGVETTLSLGADYAVSGVGEDGGGAVETAVAHPAGCLVTLILNVPFIQEIDLENQGAYFAETIERALDEGVQRDLQLAEEVARAFKLRPLGRAGGGGGGVRLRRERRRHGRAVGGRYRDGTGCRRHRQRRGDAGGRHGRSESADRRRRCRPG